MTERQGERELISTIWKKKGARMQYRKFGKLGWKGSALGFGAMRLPVRNDDYTNIDESEAT